MRHGDPCPRPMPLQPHVLRTSRSYPEGRLRIKRMVHLNVGTKKSYREAGNTERAAVHGVDDIKENSLVATVGTEKVSAPEAEARGASGSTTNRSLRLLL
ncbi:hypothetical protein BHE74_00031091 [Ensete ventricosum]|nr:hypothetical protein BHE74_00031091 [Ensete ventricosum]